MRPDRNDVRPARSIRWTVWLAVASVAASLTVWPLLNRDVIDVLDGAITALRTAETALGHAAAGLDTAAEARREQGAGSVEPDALSDAARQAESAAEATRRATVEARTVVTRVRHMRMERPGTFAEALAAVRALRDAARALTAAAEALRDAAEALREAGAVRAAYRALLAADDTIDAASSVIQAAEAVLDGDERFDPPPPLPSEELAAQTTRRARPPPTIRGFQGHGIQRGGRYVTPHAPPRPARLLRASSACVVHPPPPAALSSARAPLSTFVRL